MCHGGGPGRVGDDDRAGRADWAGRADRRERRGLAEQHPGGRLAAGAAAGAAARHDRPADGAERSGGVLRGAVHRPGAGHRHRGVRRGEHPGAGRGAAVPGGRDAAAGPGADGRRPADHHHRGLRPGAHRPRADRAGRRALDGDDGRDVPGGRPDPGLPRDRDAGLPAPQRPGPGPGARRGPAARRGHRGHRPARQRAGRRLARGAHGGDRADLGGGRGAHGAGAGGAVPRRARPGAGPLALDHPGRRRRHRAVAGHHGGPVRLRAEPGQLRVHVRPAGRGGDQHAVAVDQRLPRHRGRRAERRDRAGDGAGLHGRPGAAAGRPGAPSSPTAPRPTPSGRPRSGPDQRTCTAGRLSTVVRSR